MFSGYDAAGVAEVLGLSDAGRSASLSGPGFHEEAVTFNTSFEPARPRSGMADRRGPSAASIEKAVEAGLPRQVLRNVAERIVGDDKAKVTALEWGVVPKTTLDRRAAKLSPQESERTERVARLFVHARRALGSEDEARVFLTAPHPELDGRTPIEASRTDFGTRRTEQILNALEYGLAL